MEGKSKHCKLLDFQIVLPSPAVRLPEQYKTQIILKYLEGVK